MKILNDFKQHDDEWYEIRKGRVTMSNAKALMTGGKGKTRHSYLMSVAAEILSTMEPDNYQSRDMMRGNELEPFALRALNRYSGTSFQPVGFVLHDDERIGCSPDAIDGDDDVIVACAEIKCPGPEYHMKYRDLAYVKAEHGPQVQGEMMVTGAGITYFASFCPWVTDRPLIVHIVGRDEDYITKLEESSITGADEVERAVEEMRAHGAVSPEIEQIANDAIQWWDNCLMELNGEVII